MGLVFGIIAAFYLTQQDLRMAILFLFCAGCMDLFDGYVATKLNQTTQFGKHLDTLVDFFTCVIMPIWMVFELLTNNPFIIGALIFYCICGLWRLANYNLVGGGKDFKGLPVPSAMSLVTVMMWFVVYYIAYGVPQIIVASSVFVVAGMAMASGFSLVKYGMWQKVSILAGIGIVIYVMFFSRGV